MTTIAIELSEEQNARLNSYVQHFGLTPEESLLQNVKRILGQPDESFGAIAARVIEKNAELSRRLA